MSIKEQFDAAVKVIQSLPKNGSFQPSDELRLRFYAFFKQANEGPNTSKKPPFYDIVNRYKWDAWKQCGDMSREQAMQYYVDELKKVIETISLTQEVTDFLDMLGPFYEFLPEEVINKSKQVNGDTTTVQGMAEVPDNEVTTTTANANFNSYDSEGDEFSDTFDTTPQADNTPSLLLNTMCDEIDHKLPNRSSHANLFRNSQNHGNVQAGSVEGHSQQPTVNNELLGFSEQLTLAIFRLQHSMDQVVNRVQTLENNSTNRLEGNARGVQPRWHLFAELSPKTTVFFLTWPFVAFFIMNYLKQFRKK